MMESGRATDVSQSLESLLWGTGTMKATSLGELSDIPIDEMQRVEFVWSDSTPERRRQLISSLRELADENVEYNFKSIFLFALGDPDPEVRAEAVDGLWEVDDLSMLDVLEEKLLDDSSVEVRSAAATALSRFTYKAAVGELSEERVASLRHSLVRAIEETERGTDLYMRAVESLSYMADVPGLHGYISGLYQSQDDDARASALIAMGRTMDERWREAVMEELGNPTAAIRFQATRAAGEMSLPDSVPALARLISDDDAQVRSIAVWALGQIGTPEAFRVLRSVLARAEDEEIQEAAWEALNEAEYSADLHAI